MRKSINKLFLLMVAAALVFTSFVIPSMSVHAEELDLEAESAILVDAETGKVLYAKDPDVALPPASMTKIMTEYLVWEAVENGDISWDTTTQISDYAYEISSNVDSSGIGLTQQQDYTVEDLYAAMAINSDNGATIALAELIAGSEGEFVEMMNAKGEELGLPEYKFVNATGLDNESLGDNYPEGTSQNDTNLLSARSSAMLGAALVNDYPEALEISSMPSTEFDGKTVENWNYMLDHDSVNLDQYFYEGVDGLKTGHTELAGFAFTGTAERDGQRLITVVMKTDSIEKRFEETAKLLDYGFDEFDTQELFPAGYQEEGEETAPVARGKEREVNIGINEAIHVPVKSGEEELYHLEYVIDEDRLNDDGELEAPVEADEVIGTVNVVYDGDAEDYGYISDETSQESYDLVAMDDVEQSNWFMLTLQSIGDFFVNMFQGAFNWVKGLFS
ncbi:D-alanyl-D-alanine carboxypeptidase family protein [Oceanobacillus timonensis]|uniref:D-alanyl-D-alanine carboxypeptidase family protein n=1 Tax=Oceanobacillus timonensis TaxID=1926285 RepID=UPI0009BB8E94|nr:D-alanyl-D-alanine carboxypeptidase family protein [Oceanobacillus timonensis]